jgi:hypothetical protein
MSCSTVTNLLGADNGATLCATEFERNRATAMVQPEWRPNTLAGLVEKRAEIAGQISHIRATLRQLIIDLDHVDAAIRIFDPSYDVEGIRQKIPSAAHRAIRGDMTRATLDALGPMTTKELARHSWPSAG